MSSIIVDIDRRFDDYTSRLSFNTHPGYCVQPQYHAKDATGIDYRTYSDAASCESSRSPGYRTCTCHSAVDVESPKTPIGISRYFNRHNLHHQHHHQQQQPTSFAIHQLLGLGADIRNLDFNYDRQLALQTVDSHSHPHTPPTPCRCTDSAHTFNPGVDASPSLSSHLDVRGSHQLDLSYYDRPLSTSVTAYYRQHHPGSTTSFGPSKWPCPRQPLQIPPSLTSWSTGEPSLPEKIVHHHRQQLQQESQHDYDDLQAYYCAARLQPSSLDMTPYDNVIRQCRNISYLPQNFGELRSDIN